MIKDITTIVKTVNVNLEIKMIYKNIKNNVSKIQMNAKKYSQNIKKI